MQASTKGAAASVARPSIYRVLGAAGADTDGAWMFTSTLLDVWKPFANTKTPMTATTTTRAPTMTPIPAPPPPPSAIVQSSLV
jgi:hypothetical protein